MIAHCSWAVLHTEPIAQPSRPVCFSFHSNLPVIHTGNRTVAEHFRPYYYILIKLRFQNCNTSIKLIAIITPFKISCLINTYFISKFNLRALNKNYNFFEILQTIHFC